MEAGTAVGHPEWNGKSSLLAQDFDTMPAIESMRAKDMHLLQMQRMKEVVHRIATRIAGIIPAGWSARLTTLPLVHPNGGWIA